MVDTGRSSAGCGGDGDVVGGSGGSGSGLCVDVGGWKCVLNFCVLSYGVRFQNKIILLLK